MVAFKGTPSALLHKVISVTSRLLSIAASQKKIYTNVTPFPLGKAHLVTAQFGYHIKGLAQN